MTVVEAKYMFKFCWAKVIQWELFVFLPEFVSFPVIDVLQQEKDDVFRFQSLWRYTSAQAHEEQQLTDLHLIKKKILFSDAAES